MNAPCLPPPGFVETPPPTLDPRDRLASRTDRIVIDRPPDAVHRRMEGARLEDTLPRTGRLPGVVGTHALTPGPFGEPGSRRLVCLSDGARALEQVLVRAPGREFRYVVWGYTTPAARPIAYGVGHFRYDAVDDGRTAVTWTYAFKLRPDRFPGMLGPLGRWLFRVAFLDRAYAELMRETLAATKRFVEAEP
jgi:hypothetical protein